MAGNALGLSSYGPVKLTVERKLVDDEQIDRQMQQLAAQIPDYLATEEPARANDKVRVHVSLVENGEPMRGFYDVDVPLVLGDGFVFEGLSNGIIGMRAGEQKDFEFEVPAVGGAGDGGETAMNKVEAHVELLEVNGAKAAVIDDAWAARNGGAANTVAELREQLRGQLQKANDSQYDEQARTFCTAALAARLTGKVPEADVARAVEGVRSQFESALAQRQMTEEQYLQQQGMTSDQLEAQFQMQGRRIAAEGAALELMADHLGITATDDDLARVFERAGAAGEAGARGGAAAGASAGSGAKALASYLAAGGDRGAVERIARCQLALDCVVADAEAAAKAAAA